MEANLTATDRLIRELERELDSEGAIYRPAFERIKLKWESKKPKPIPQKRAKKRRNRETPAKHAEVKRQLCERAEGICERARIRRDGKIVYEHAPDCPLAVSLHRGDPAHNKSRGSSGAWELQNLRWVSRQCHNWEHHGGKVIPPKSRKEPA